MPQKEGNVVAYLYLFIFRGWGGDILVLMTLLNDEIVVNSSPGLKAFKDISSLICRLKVIKAIFFIAVQLHLNRQVITLLSGLKIRNDFFQELQEKMLFELSDMLLDNDVALVNLREVSSFSLSL